MSAFACTNTWFVRIADTFRTQSGLFFFAKLAELVHSRAIGETSIFCNGRFTQYPPYPVFDSGVCSLDFLVDDIFVRRKQTLLSNRRTQCESSITDRANVLGWQSSFSTDNIFTSTKKRIDVRI